MMDNQQVPPKVFISYSWSSEEHTEWVADLGERLMNDGIEVVLDQWSLEEGQDVNVFMEKMVTDSSIKRVIIICDAIYADKADGRRGGVGTETQIISKEVYESVDQNKFIPIVRERDEGGSALLPVYLKARKYIDFSDPDSEADAYDQLIRNIYERPKRRTPALGRRPAHLFEDAPVQVSSAQKGKRFRDLVESGKGKPSVAFEDFVDEFIANLEALRMTYTREEQDQWCDRIKANIAVAHAHRNVFVDVVRTGASHLSEDEFMPALLTFLERMLPLTDRPNVAGAYYEVSEDNYKFLCYEFFLYTVAAFNKARKYTEVRQLIDHRYVVASTYGGSDLEGRGFARFNQYARSLEEFCAQQGDRRRLSVMADLLHERADRTDIRYSDLCQADVVLCLAAKGRGWYPRSIIYSRDIGRLELFLRAVTVEGFHPLGIVLGLKSPQELLSLITDEDLPRLLQCERFWHADVTLEMLNIDELQQRWGST